MDSDDRSRCILFCCTQLTNDFNTHSRWQVLEQLWATGTAEDKESSRRLFDVLWDRFFTVCQARIASLERWQRARVDDADDSKRMQEDTNPQGSAPRGVMFRHHAQLLALTYYFQDARVRRALLFAHLGLVRKMSALVVVLEVSRGKTQPSSSHPRALLSQCIALAEFMLRTLHDSECSISLGARLRSDVARASHMPPVAPASGPEGNSDNSVGNGKHSQYLTIFEPDEEIGFTAWHERPGAARASIRSLWSETCPEGFAEWRQALMGVLNVAVNSRPSDMAPLFFRVWRLLGTLPPEHVANDVVSVGEHHVHRIQHLEPEIDGMARLRSCLLGLQSSGKEWGLFSSAFSTALSAIQEGLPRWFGLEPKALAEAMIHVSDSSLMVETSVKVLCNQLRVHGLVEVFTVYARAAIAEAQQQQRRQFNPALPFFRDGLGSSTMSDGLDGPDGLSSPLVALSLGLMELAEESYRYYQRMIEAALTALHAVGRAKPSRFDDHAGSSDGTSSIPVDDTGRGDQKNVTNRGCDDGRATEAQASRVPAEIAVPIAIRIHCHTLSSSVSRLTSLGFDHYLIGGLHAELNYPSDDTALEQLPSWQKYACVRSTSRSGKLSSSHAEPDELSLAEEGNRRRDGSSAIARVRGVHQAKNWEVMVNTAVWNTVALSHTLSGSSGTERDVEFASPADASFSAQDFNAVLESAVKMCLSARATLNGALRALMSLTDVLASLGNVATMPSVERQGNPAPSREVVPDEKISLEACEAWSEVSVRAAALLGEVSTNPWCKWFSPLCGHAFDKLVLSPEPSRVGSSTAEAERKQEKARAAYVLWTEVTGARLMQRADSLIRMALDGFGEASMQDVDEDGDKAHVLDWSQVCADVALDEGLEQLLALLSMPPTAIHVSQFYCKAGDAPDDGVSVSPEGMKVAEAISAVVRCRLSKQQGVEPQATGTGTGGTRRRIDDFLVPTGDATTLTSLLGHTEFSSFVPKALQVLRTALEIEACSTLPSEASSTDQHPKRMTNAVASAMLCWSDEALHGLVAGATASRSNEVCSRACGTEDALFVLSVAVGYPATGGLVMASKQQDVLRKRFLHALLLSAKSWAGRRTETNELPSSSRRRVGSGSRNRVDSGKGRGSLVVVDPVSVALWMAFEEGMFADLAAAVMAVARTHANMLDSGRHGGGVVQMETDDEMTNRTTEEEEQEEEAAKSLVRCLELMVMIFRPSHVSAVKDEESETDTEDVGVIPDFTGQLGGTRIGEPEQSSARDAPSVPAIASGVTAGGPGASDEPPLVCTFVSNQKQFVNQHWYHCYTCNLVHDKGCCRLCVRLCHRGHDVSYARLSCFFCDCGSGAAEGEDCDATPVSSSSGGVVRAESSSVAGVASGIASTTGGAAQDSSRVKCDCLKPRTRRELNVLLRPSAALEKGTAASSPSALVPGSRGRSRGGRQGAVKKRRRTSVAAAALKATASTTTEEQAIRWRESMAQIDTIRSAVFSEGDKPGIFEDLFAVYSSLVARFDKNIRECGGLVGVSGTDRGATLSYSTGGALEANQLVALCDATKSTSVLMAPLPSRSAVAHPILAPARLVKNGSLDVRLPAEGAQARRDRAAVAVHGVVRRNLASTSCGKVAVAEVQKVLIVDPVGALTLRYDRASADVPVDRSHVCVLSTTAVGFDVMGLVFNPANERHLVAWGLRQCCVIVLDSRGVAQRRVQVCKDRERRGQSSPFQIIARQSTGLFAVTDNATRAHSV